MIMIMGPMVRTDITREIIMMLLAVGHHDDDAGGGPVHRRAFDYGYGPILCGIGILFLSHTANNNIDSKCKTALCMLLDCSILVYKFVEILILAIEDIPLLGGHPREQVRTPHCQCYIVIGWEKSSPHSLAEGVSMVSKNLQRQE
jgi:hypothetical protein